MKKRDLTFGVIALMLVTGLMGGCNSTEPEATPPPSGVSVPGTAGGAQAGGPRAGAPVRSAPNKANSEIIQ